MFHYDFELFRSRFVGPPGVSGFQYLPTAAVHLFVYITAETVSALLRLLKKFGNPINIQIGIGIIQC